MGTKIITPPTLIADSGGVVTAAKLRGHLRIAADGMEDGLMTDYFAAAHAAAEHYTGRAIGAQTRELALDAFPDQDINLGPAVTAITSLKYIDANGVEQTVSSLSYTLDDYSQDCWLVPAVGVTWPVTKDVANAVKVRFQAGDVPGSVLSALLLMTTWLFENAGDDGRATDDIQPPAAKSLLSSAKVWGF